MRPAFHLSSRQGCNQSGCSGNWRRYANENIFKLFLLDVGLLGCMAGIQPGELLRQEYGTYKGWFAENYVAQELTAARLGPLYFWQGRQAEVEFVAQTDRGIVPVEVKAGKSGTLKSLHVFLREKKRSLALRFNSAPPSLLDTHTSLADGQQVQFRLLSLPLYLIGQARRLLREASGN